MKAEQKETIQIPTEMAGDRIDGVLSHLLPDLSRNAIQKLIEKGNVTINGTPCQSKNQKVKGGEQIALHLPPPEQLTVEGENIPLDICYEDKDLLVVNKPRGMVVHPAPGNETGTLVNAILYHCGDRLSSINGIVRPGIVHRIDKDTSGLLVVAKSDKAHGGLAKQFADHTITRAYLAILHNNLKQDQGTVAQPIGRDPKNRLRRAVTQVNAKPAVTHYRVLERFGAFTIIEATLETGRTHQIRVHMAHTGHPVLGDPLYGPKKPALGAKGQMLHARLLGFCHPTNGTYMEFSCEPPEAFEAILQKISRKYPRP